MALELSPDQRRIWSELDVDELASRAGIDRALEDFLLVCGLERVDTPAPVDVRAHLAELTPAT